MAVCASRGQSYTLDTKPCPPDRKGSPPPPLVTATSMNTATPRRMKRVRPRRLVHRGVVDAVGVVIDAHALAEGPTPLRVLSAWSGGSTVHSVAGGWYVAWPASRKVRAETALGAAVTRERTGDVTFVTTTPLAARERESLLARGALSGDLVRAVGGDFLSERVSSLAQVDLSTWLDLGDIHPVATRSLGLDPPRVVVTEPESPRTVREIFGVGVRAGAPAPDGARLSDALRSALEALMRDRATARRPEAGANEGRGETELMPEGPSQGGFLSGVLTAMVARLAAVMSFLSAWFRARGTAAPGPARLPPARRKPRETPREEPREDPPPPSGPSWFERFTTRLDELFKASLVRERLASLLGRKHAEYIAKMMEMFERGDLFEALRHAIPLSDDKLEGSGGMPLPPSPRERLDITFGGGGGRPAVGLDGRIYDTLRSLYRSAFERLEREGRIDEAAFVLAELLRDVPGAVAFLERHGRLKRAAELAEAAKLAPELVIRQWLVAGDRARAVLHARRVGAFEVAVVKLEQSDPALGALLRREWAELLAGSGDYARAVEVAWTVPAMRELAHGWIDLVIAAGGVGAAKMLARKLVLRPETYLDVRARVVAMCVDTDRESVDARAAFTTSMLANLRTDESATLARPLARALISDVSRTGDEALRALLKRAVDFSLDGALRTDLPPLTTFARAALRDVTTPVWHRVDANDVGACRAYDAVSLPDGRVLVALGEAGLKVLTREGGTAFHLDAPAHRLVRSDHGDRALALARRGKVWRVARVDLLGRRAQVWSEARLEAFADTFDGETWIVAQEGEILILDATRDAMAALRRVMKTDPRSDGRPSQIEREESSCAVVFTEDLRLYDEDMILLSEPDGGRGWSWTYELPRWTLRARRELPGFRAGGWVAVNALGADVRLSRKNGLNVLFDEGRRSVSPTWSDDTDIGDFQRAVMSREWLALAFKRGAGVCVALLDIARGAPRLVVELARSTEVFVRFQGDRMTVVDDLGRVLVIELGHGALVRNLRL